MIECKNEGTLALLTKDYDALILILSLSLLIVLYLERSLTKALFKSCLVLGFFLILDMSCYHIGYIKGLVVSFLCGTQLESVYQLVRYFVIEWLYKKKKQILKILEREHIEIDDDTKDKPDKAK